MRTGLPQTRMAARRKRCVDHQPASCGASEAQTRSASPTIVVVNMADPVELNWLALEVVSNPSSASDVGAGHPLGQVLAAPAGTGVPIVFEHGRDT